MNARLSALLAGRQKGAGARATLHRASSVGAYPGCLAGRLQALMASPDPSSHQVSLCARQGRHDHKPHQAARC